MYDHTFINFQFTRSDYTEIIEDFTLSLEDVNYRVDERLMIRGGYNKKRRSFTTTYLCQLFI